MDEAKKKMVADQLFEKRLKACDLGSWVGNNKVVSMLRKFYVYGILDRSKLYNVKDAQLPEQYDRRKKLMKSDIDLLRKLRADGWTLMELAHKFNVSATACRYWCSEQARLESRACSSKWKKAHPLSKSEMRRRVESSLQYKRKLREEGKL